MSHFGKMVSHLMSHLDKMVSHLGKIVSHLVSHLGKMVSHPGRVVSPRVRSLLVHWTYAVPSHIGLTVGRNLERRCEVKQVVTEGRKAAPDPVGHRSWTDRSSWLLRGRNWWRIEEQKRA